MDIWVGLQFGDNDEQSSCDPSHTDLCGDAHVHLLFCYIFALQYVIPLEFILVYVWK